MALEITLHFTDQAVDPANKQPFTLFPGEVNNTSTSLTVVGQGTMNYGRYIMENFLHLLENFCSDTAPHAPTRGQLWYDTDEDTMKVLQSITTAGNGSKTYNWSTLGGVYVSNVEPTDTSLLWYDVSAVSPLQHQLKVFNAGQNSWVSVADRYVLKAGDSLAGSLVFTPTGTGITGTSGGFTNTFTPVTSRGPVVIGGKHATVVINNASASPTGSEFVIGAGTDVTSAVSSNSRLMTVADSGIVTIHKNVLNMSGFKIQSLANGTSATDAVTLGQLTSSSANLQQQIDLLDNSVAGINSNLNNVVLKTGSTMSGGLIINNTLYVGAAVTFAAGLNVSGGNVTVNGNSTFARSVAVSGTATMNSAAVVNSVVIGGTAQLNNTLTVNGLTTLRSVTVVEGAATFTKAVSITGNTTLGGTLTVAGLVSMNQPIASITNAKNLTTKEYVDAKFSSIPQPKVPTGLWAGTTTLANIAATYTNINLYPPGTTVAYNYSWSYTFGTGNGAATGTKTARRLAVRTVTEGWIDADPVPSLYM